MSEIIVASNEVSPRPLPNVNVHVRPGVVGDLSFIDSLQKLHSKQVGWMPTATLEGKIKLGHVLVAEVGGRMSSPADALAADAAAGDSRPPEPVGYCIGNDQYFKRDDVGIIYQMNVLPGKQRGLIGASLLKAMFDRSAYGCKLYCCWCAQDIAANQFWEAMGFVPLAFRTGSEKKGPKGSPRTHIFWQKRIRSGDCETPWWFPSKTAGGSIREDRIVLPIPPGTHWSDAKPLLLPGYSAVNEVNDDRRPAEQLNHEDTKSTKEERKTKRNSSSCPSCLRGEQSPLPIRRNGLLFDIPQPGEPLPDAKPIKAKKPKAEKIKRKCDPRLVAAARELRDRWLEQMNAAPLLPAGKYDVTRAIADQSSGETGPIALLAA